MGATATATTINSVLPPPRVPPTVCIAATTITTTASITAIISKNTKMRRKTATYTHFTLLFHKTKSRNELITNNNTTLNNSHTLSHKNNYSSKNFILSIFSKTQEQQQSINQKKTHFPPIHIFACLCCGSESFFHLFFVY
eukprot:PhM_4_TR11664/c1_g1_i2/m.64183